MTKGWKQWLEDKGAAKLFRRENLVVLVLAGILLFVIALPTKDSRDTGGAVEGLSDIAAQKNETIVQGAADVSSSEQAYAADLERRLTDALADMEQVGRVKVMITLKSSSELVVERETPVSRSATTETDAQGGSRSINTTDMEETVVYSTNGSSSEPYVIKTYVPEIEGVLVVAEGAGSGTVNRTVTEIVQALFGVEAHKVKVVKMETKTK